LLLLRLRLALLLMVVVFQVLVRWWPTRCRLFALQLCHLVRLLSLLGLL
jgi:hypothetical protein